MEFIRRTAVKLLENVPGVYSHALLRKKSPLRDWGWFRSFAEQRSVDADGTPLPWLTYGAIEFLRRRVKPTMTVFEYGAGDGTLWWAERVAHVDAVEHDEVWFRRVQDRMPANVELRHIPLENGAYAASIAATGRSYDIVVIDGRDRNACAAFAADALKPEGIIVWDDSARERYREGLDVLLSRGFRMINFPGFSPIEFMMCETAILYRDGNCLGI